MAKRTAPSYFQLNRGPPLSAAEIQAGLGISKAQVRKVERQLREMGLLPPKEESPQVVTDAPTLRMKAKPRKPVSGKKTASPTAVTRCVS